MSNPPSPSGGNLLLGHAPAFKRDPLAFIQELAQLGDISTFWMGPIRCFFVNSPEHIRTLLIENDLNRDLPSKTAGKPFIRDGLFTVDDKVHHQERKAVLPAFNHNLLPQYAAQMATRGHEVSQSWTDGNEIDMHRSMTDLTLQIVEDTLFGGAKTDHQYIYDVMVRFQDLVNAEMRGLFPLPNWLPTPHKARLRQNLNEFRKIIDQVVEQAKATKEQGGILMNILTSGSLEESFSEGIVQDITITLFIAGHETTASGMTWLIELLAWNPEIQQQLYEEAYAVLQGCTPTFYDMDKLNFAEQAVKEALRLFPPAYLLGREAKEDTQFGEYLVPKGSQVYFSAYTMQRRSDYYPEPDKFDPSRFTPEREKQLPRYAWMPFGAGPRVCLGQQFAMMEMKLLIADLIQQWEFTPVADKPIDLAGFANLRPGGPVPIRVTKRTHAEPVTESLLEAVPAK